MSLASSLPPRRPQPKRPSAAPPATAPGAPAPVDLGPPRGVPERRRRKRGRLALVLTSPLPATVEARMSAVLRPAARVLRWAVPVLCVAALAWVLGDAWMKRGASLAPRHRAEALCFALASPPPFAPPMRVEPSAAMLRGRFSVGTPPGMALREAMRFDDRMVLSERTRHIGDYDVTTAWLKLPGTGSSQRWLVVGWMEGADLGVCSFHFMGDADELTPEEQRWGNRLLGRILVPSNFHAGVLPDVRLRAARDGELPTFGPPARS